MSINYKIIFILLLLVLFLSSAGLVQGQQEGSYYNNINFNDEQELRLYESETLPFRNYGERTSLEILSDIITFDEEHDMTRTYGINHPLPWYESGLYSSSTQIRNTEERYWELVYIYLEYQDINNPACIEEEFFSRTSDGEHYATVYSNLNHLASQNISQFNNQRLLEAFPYKSNDNGELLIPADKVTNIENGLEIVANSDSRFSNANDVSEYLTNNENVNLDLQQSSKLLFRGLDDERLEQHLYLNYRLGFGYKSELMEHTRDKRQSVKPIDETERWNERSISNFEDIASNYTIEYLTFNFFGEDDEQTRAKLADGTCSKNVHGSGEEGWFDDLFSITRGNMNQNQVSFYGTESQLKNASNYEFHGPGGNEYAHSSDLTFAHTTVSHMEPSTRVGQYVEDINNPNFGSSTDDGQYRPPFRVSGDTTYYGFTDWVHEPQKPQVHGDCPYIEFTGRAGSSIVDVKYFVYSGDEDDSSVEVIEDVDVENTTHGIMKIENLGSYLSKNTYQFEVEVTIEAQWGYNYYIPNDEGECIYQGSYLMSEFVTVKEGVPVVPERMQADDYSNEPNIDFNVEKVIDAYPQGTIYQLDIEVSDGYAEDHYGYWSHIDSTALPEDEVLSRGSWGYISSRNTEWDETFVGFSERLLDNGKVDEISQVEDLTKISPVTNYAIPNVRPYEERQETIDHGNSISTRTETTVPKVYDYDCDDIIYYDNCAWNFDYDDEIRNRVNNFEDIEGQQVSLEETLSISGFTRYNIDKDDKITLHGLVKGNTISREPEKYIKQEKLYMNITNVTETSPGIWEVKVRFEDENGNLKGKIDTTRTGETLVARGSHSSAYKEFSNVQGNPVTLVLEDDVWETSMYIELDHNVNINDLIESEPNVEEIYYIEGQRTYHMGNILPTAKTIAILIILWYILEKIYTYLLIATGTPKAKAENRKFIPVSKYLQIPKPAIQWRKALHILNMLSLSYWLGKFGKGKGNIEGPDEVPVGEVAKFKASVGQRGKGRAYRWSIESSPARPTKEAKGRAVEHVWKEPGEYSVVVKIKKGPKTITARKKVTVT